MAIIELSELPKFQIVRTFAGLAGGIVAAEALLALDDAGYPRITYAFSSRHAEEGVVYWDAATPTPGDTLDVSVYVLDGGLAAPIWLLVHTEVALPRQEVARVNFLRSTLCLLRVTGAAVGVATAGVTLRAALLEF